MVLYFDLYIPPPVFLLSPYFFQGTSEQRALVRDILKAGSDLYAILSLPKSASDDDIKRAYRKLALKLHPDKNQAARADEAFKAISKAFSCLSDPDKRAYYDRTGFESSSAAAAAAASQRSPGGRAAGEPIGLFCKAVPVNDNMGTIQTNKIDFIASGVYIFFVPI